MHVASPSIWYIWAMVICSHQIIFMWKKHSKRMFSSFLIYKLKIFCQISKILSLTKNFIKYFEVQWMGVFLPRLINRKLCLVIGKSLSNFTSAILSNNVWDTLSLSNFTYAILTTNGGKYVWDTLVLYMSQILWTYSQ